MKKARFTEVQIMAILKQHAAGVRIADLSREHNISRAVIYQWREVWRHGRIDDEAAERTGS